MEGRDVRPALGDVAVRARGLAGHLLSRSDLERLARISGSGVLARALEALGYWPAPSEGSVAGSTADYIDAAIEHEIMRRLALLGRWLAERRGLFVGVFEEQERRALRIQLRRLAAGETHPLSHGARQVGFGLPRGMRDALERAGDIAGLLTALGRIGSPYAEPLQAALRSQGEDLLSLETTLDQTFAGRARRAAERQGGRLLSWVMDGIDLENAWGAVLEQTGGFVDGGCRLSRERHATIAREADDRQRRRQLAKVFARSSMSSIFEDPDAPLAVLETRALRARIAAERSAARIDPIGPSPILECVMRMRAEHADLRRINWGIAVGMPAEAIVGQLLAAT
jgi:vacuolar-type H+-ATPase subunit C/Vma6